MKEAEKNNKKKEKVKNSIFSVGQYVTFWLLAAFTVSCCLLLFLSHAEISEAIIRERAPLVFLNIFILTAVFTGIDVIRRNYTVKRPVEQILRATKNPAGRFFSPDSGTLSVKPEK